MLRGDNRFSLQISCQDTTSAKKYLKHVEMQNLDKKRFLLKEEKER